MKTKLLFISMLALTSLTVSAQDYDNPGGKIDACAGKFNDKGGSAASYGNNEKIVTTICSSTPDSCIMVDFTYFFLDSKSKDILKIYDGADTMAAVIGSYTYFSGPGTVTSSKGCLTFKFTSDTSQTGNGWEADISCTSKCALPLVGPGGMTNLCAGKFIDSGGDKNYGNNEKSVTTICSSVQDSCIQVDFTDFGLDASKKDILKIYDGADTLAGFIGSYTYFSGPGTVTSSKGCLTFKFTSDSSNTSKGWEADIRCTSKCAPPVINPIGTQTLSLCSGKFLDSGGDKNYSNNEKSLTTLCSSVKDSCIEVDFTYFGLDASKKDILKIYDGADTLAGVIGAYTYFSGPGTVTSSKGCLTFKFTSDSSTTAAGWEADISCTSKCAPSIINPIGTQTLSLCSGKFYDSGGSVNDYGNNENNTTTLCSNSSGNPIQVDFTAFGLNSDATDVLKIYDGADINALLIGSYTWFTGPGTVTSTASCLTFQFTSDGSGTSGGWEADITCPGAISVPEIAAFPFGFDLTLKNNPATTQLTAQLYSVKGASFTLDIMDMQGRVVSREIIKASKGFNPVVVDLNTMDKGMYIIRINDNVNSVQKRFLKL